VSVREVELNEENKLIPSAPKCITSDENYGRLFQALQRQYPDDTIQQLANRVCRSPGWVAEKLKTVEGEE
jgi:hypothetical protein